MGESLKFLLQDFLNAILKMSQMRQVPATFLGGTRSAMWLSWLRSRNNLARTCQWRMPSKSNRFQI